MKEEEGIRYRWKVMEKNKDYHQLKKNCNVEKILKNVGKYCN